MFYECHTFIVYFISYTFKCFSAVSLFVLCLTLTSLSNPWLPSLESKISSSQGHVPCKLKLNSSKDQYIQKRSMFEETESS